ncbi:MAG: ferric reductase-like transmembrane domain-containing protein [Rhizobiales bacterium]|nr:ferric reductase-like transmembrane domain-containing protein [Hyphomicrobiales bacterium]
MTLEKKNVIHIVFFWCALIAALAVPFIFVVTSPLLAWRSPIYIIACFSGVVGLGLLLIQPLLIGGSFPGLSKHLARRAHPWIGTLLLLAVLGHVGGLWITSPPDVIDALTFNSPTPFSNWGVIAMLSLFTTTLLAIFRRRLRLRPINWRLAHSFLALVIVIGTIVHAILIEGTMETMSKATLCLLVLVATINTLFGALLLTGLRSSAKQ